MRLRPSSLAATASGTFAPASSARVGKMSRWQASLSTSAPALSVPGHRQNEAARVPPLYGEFLLPRIPALKTPTPAVPPLSFMKMTRVFFSMPHSANFASSRPRLSSMLVIMPKKAISF